MVSPGITVTDEPEKRLLMGMQSLVYEREGTLFTPPRKGTESQYRQAVCRCPGKMSGLSVQRLCQWL